MNKNKLELNILRGLSLFGVSSLIYLIKRPPTKDWLLIFFFKGYLSSIVDTLVVRKGYIKYPVKLFKYFDTSVIFDYLLFPLSCVLYNQLTKNGELKNIFLKVFLFSIPMTLAEFFLERKTNLIKYKKGWNSLHTFSSITLTFLFVRLFIQVIRIHSQKQKSQHFTSHPLRDMP